MTGRLYVVAVTGGRRVDNREAVWAALDVLDALRPITKLIHGGASGADALAASWAGARKVPIQAFEARWGSEGRAAGPLRNARMLSEGRPDLVLAFPGGRGTADMVAKSKAAGVPVIEVCADVRQMVAGIHSND